MDARLKIAAQLTFGQWWNVLVSAAFAGMVAGGSALLGAASVDAGRVTQQTLVVALATGLVAMARDVRQQLNLPPGYRRKGDLVPR